MLLCLKHSDLGLVHHLSGLKFDFFLNQSVSIGEFNILIDDQDDRFVSEFLDLLHILAVMSRSLVHHINMVILLKYYSVLWPS